MTILIVDDSKIIRRMLTGFMGEFYPADELTLLEAEDGLVAMEKMNSVPSVDLVLLDWNMPKMNGEQVVDAIRADLRFKETKIIMATTEGAKLQVVKMIKKGVNGYLVKPFKEAVVRDAIENIGLLEEED
ncbi:MAG: response regulator [Helicobacteraceae bacterium]|nr:response regulator [Helicobacteraceae bacterium]